MTSSRPARLRASVAFTAALALGGGLLVASGTSAAHAEPDPTPNLAQCPDAFPHGALDEGQAVTGLTTTRGTTPEEFSGTYVGTLTEGIGRQRDLLVFRLEGSRITKADGSPDAGIWAGISGSPVYAEDGRLVGAVSYGFNEGGDTLAGVTPAEYVYGVKALSEPGSVSLGPLRRQLARQDVDVSARASLRQLESVRQVSGFSSRHTPQVRRIAGRAGVSAPTHVGGSAATGASPELPVVAGGNVGASWSWGDITLASLGSVTAVCDSDVFAFGHPDEWAGDTSQAMHGASGVAISAGTNESYKLANLGAPVGTLLQDRLEGLHGQLGPVPVSVDLRSTTTYRGRTFTGSTQVSETSELPFVTALQSMSDTMTAMNAAERGGTSLIGWTIQLQRANGKVENLKRSQRYSTRVDLAEALVSDVASDVEEILENPFEKVSVRRVSITNNLQDGYRAYKLAKVERFTKGKWHRLGSSGTIKIKRGWRLKLRLTLAPENRHSSVGTTTRVVTIRTSKHAARDGRVFLAGQSYGWEDHEDYEDFEDMWWDEDDEDDPFLKPEVAPRNLTQLLSQMRRLSRQDQVLTTVAHRGRSTGRLVNTTRTTQLGAIVSGERVYRLRFF